MANMGFEGRMPTGFYSSEGKQDRREALSMNTAGSMGKWQTGKRDCFVFGSSLPGRRPETPGQ